MVNYGQVGGERVNELEAYSEELGRSIDVFIDYLEHNLSEGAFQSIAPLLRSLRDCYLNANERLSKICEEDEILKR
ncbi:MAG: hypothetical protein QXI33_02515 [Candidatus Pacearchaeota archaeon]